LRELGDAFSDVACGSYVLIPVIENSADSVSHMNDIEVQQQSKRFVGKTEIREQLSFMDRQ
jgi:hypothetical protein